MFETEDMLPRTAPKPSSSLGLNEPAAKPTVPEVSILFGQSAATTTCTNNPMQQNKTPVQSYASWRKQMLPKVTYPPGADCGFSTGNVVVSSNVYPMRTYAISSSITTNGKDNGVPTYINRNEGPALQQRRSLEGYAPIYSNTQTTAAVVSSNPNTEQIQQQEQQYMRRSLESLSAQRTIVPPPLSSLPLLSRMPETPLIRSLPASDVLTICAGTQTDVIDSIAQCNNEVATKQDYQKLLIALQEMRAEQQRLTQICVLLLEQQQLQATSAAKKETTVTDACTQYEQLVQVCQQRPAVLIKDYHTAEQYEVEESPEAILNYRQKCLSSSKQQQQSQQNNQNFVSPHIRPNAHSTEYRSNSPLINNKPLQQQQQTQQQQNVVLPKPATEQSMVMNELALKYLPNDKLNEMLQDMRLSPTQQKVINGVDYAATKAATPLRNIENFDKGPNDISNASYKYLKKYRLLSEEQQHHQQEHQQQQQRVSPLLQRQQKLQFQCEQSPFTGHPRAMQENLLDLDAIRRQPKFL